MQDAVGRFAGSAPAALGAAPPAGRPAAQRAPIVRMRRVLLPDALCCSLAVWLLANAAGGNREALGGAVALCGACLAIMRGRRQGSDHGVVPQGGSDPIRSGARALSARRMPQCLPRTAAGGRMPPARATPRARPPARRGAWVAGGADAPCARNPLLSATACCNRPARADAPLGPGYRPGLLPDGAIIGPGSAARALPAQPGLAERMPSDSLSGCCRPSRREIADTASLPAWTTYIMTRGRAAQ